MAGTHKGGLQTAQTNRVKYGPDFYAKIGAQGGAKRVAKGFAKMPKSKTRTAGAKGGQLSRRTWTDEQRKAHGELLRNARAKKSAEKQMPWWKRLWGRA